MSLTEKIRQQGLDKFYTKQEISIKCINKLFELYDNIFDIIIEPSAGNGSFYNNINYDNKIGLDIQPEDKNIIKMNFFDYKPIKKYKKILVIGNPPFGKNSSLAIKFFNYASKWASVIAFIVPKTFRKISIQNKLNLSFHLIYDEEIPSKPCSFEPPMNVKCCFQIWEKNKNKREIIKLKLEHPDWIFIPFGPKDENGQPTPPKNVDFAIRAYGGKCGEIVTKNLDKLRPKSWHWIKANINKDKLINNFNKLDYSNSLNTARQNSIGKGELVQLYINCINSKI